MLSELLLLSLLLGNAYPDKGLIGGVVLNGSANRTPVAGADVVLRARLDGEFQTVAETTTDDQGRYFFEQLPMDETLIYLPGANRDGIHYPGQRIRLSPQRPNIDVDLIVHNTVTYPSPLVIERCEIEISVAPSVLRVREVLIIANPTSSTYIGQTARENMGDQSEPVTLRLDIPSDFEQITFDKEFFGRRFSIVDAKLVTHIPWTPGRKEMAFTYLLRNEKKERLIERTLDLPCSQIQVRVLTERREDVSCNLTADATAPSGEVIFKSNGETLPIGYVIRIELGQLPVSWTTYGRPIAAVALVVLIAVASLVIKGNKRKAKIGKN